MADISDVEEAMKNIVSGVLYPNGVNQPSVLPNAAQVRVFRGWPLSPNLDADLKAGISNVSIWPRGGIEHNTTRYKVDFQEVSRGVASFTAITLKNNITIGGAANPAVRQFVTVQVGPKIVGSYEPASTDGPNDIAAILAAQITAQGVVALSAGPVITVQSGMDTRAVVGVDAQEIAEVARTETMVQVTLWCPSHAVRDAISQLIMPPLADATFLTMPDGSACRIRFHMNIMNNEAEKPGLYRRDILYTTEYAITVSDTSTEVTSAGVGITSSDGAGGLSPPVQVYYPFPSSSS